MAEAETQDVETDSTSVVAALHIGNTFSTYAWATKRDLESGYDDYIYPAWKGNGILRNKMPSRVLFTPDKKFHSCGYEAEDHYAELVLDKNHDDWLFFEKFKMILYGRLGSDVVIKDIKGKSMKANYVFTSLINYMVSHLIRNCRKIHSHIQNIHIKWVLTIPAIWDDSSRKFLQEAAENAGISRSQLVFALEPECGVLHYRHIQEKSEMWNPETKFMVLDCGGERMEATVYKVSGDNEVNEVYKSNGGNWGGSLVDAALLKLLSEISHQDMEEIQEHEKLDLLREMEIKKKGISDDLEFKITIKVPCIVIEKLCRDDEIRNTLKLRTSGDKIRMEPELAKSLYHETSNKLGIFLKELLRKPELQNLQYIMMIGGFSESPMVQHFVKNVAKQENTSITVVVPKAAGLAAINGAVMFGHKQDLRYIRNDFCLVAAIDFGTTFSGYAWATRKNTESDKFFTRNWIGGVGGTMMQKTSSCVLFQPDGKLHSCGFEAEDHYADLAIENKQNDWFFFRRFKMTLYKQLYLERDAMLKDDKGKKMAAKDVFTSIIAYLKTQLINDAQDQYKKLFEDDIKWVLTVPAIWNDSSKQFMREAAVNAGIKSSHLSIALEPECGAFYCRQLPIEKLGLELEILRPGTRYMVLDCGGGTVDIAVHEILQDRKIKELYKANGGDGGGIQVDAAFLNLLSDIIGQEIMTKFVTDNKYDELALLRDFEIKKKLIFPNLQKKITFKAPIAIEDTFKQVTASQKVDIPTEYAGKIIWNWDKLSMTPEIAISLYDESRSKLKTILTELLEKPMLQNVHMIIMIGGFSESPMIQDIVRNVACKQNSSIQIVVPKEAGLAVLKGAVLYGYNPDAIYSRVCRYTYGIKTVKDYDPELDPADLLFTTSDGKKKCYDRFSVIVKAGTEIIINESEFMKNFSPAEPDQTSFSFEVYVTTAPTPPRHVRHCTKVGNLVIKSPDTSLGKDRNFIVTMQFRYTESTVTVIEEHTGKELTASFDFLG